MTLRCDALGKPRPTFSWYKNSQPLVPVSGEIEIVSNVLTILRAQVGKHGGMYECTATNTHGTSITSAQVKVLCTSSTFSLDGLILCLNILIYFHVNVILIKNQINLLSYQLTFKKNIYLSRLTTFSALRPTFIKYPLPNTLLAAENGNLTIPCQPEAAPAPEITWVKNGAQMSLSFTNGNQNGAQMLLNGYLKIVGVSLGDGGFYTCHAKNIHGDAQTTTNVIVSSMALVYLLTDYYNYEAKIQAKIQIS